MSTFDNLNAPQFSTFDDSDSEELETYFDFDHESRYFSPTESPAVLNLRNRKVKRVSVSDSLIPIRNDVVNQIVNALKDTDLNKEEDVNLVKEEPIPTVMDTVDESIHTGKVSRIIHNLERAASSDSLLNNQSPKENLEPKKNGFKYGQLRKPKSSSQLRLKFCSQESLNRLAAPKILHSSAGSIPHASKEYVSVAEAVRKFQMKTPERFHSSKKKQEGPFSNLLISKLKPTIPQSPKLLTKTRVKPSSSLMSHEEREKLEFEEAQRFKIKANPVNKKILRGPMKAIHFEKKPSTIPEPFELTQVQSKKHIPSPKIEEYQFHAKPVPKSVLEPKKLPQKALVKPTEPVTPSFMRNFSKASPIKKVPERIGSSPLKKTKPAPFSFEERDKKMHEKKEELRKQALEEEKKAREFHARPIPKPVASMMRKQRIKSLDETTNPSSVTRKSNENIQVDVFKARPAVVLHQKPFLPKKPENPLTELQPFDLNGEERARRRKEFERKRKEQEEQAMELLKMEEEERLKQEQEEIKKLRKNIDFKAKPVRKYKEVQIQPSGKVTEPISPVFRSGKKNKENIEELEK